MMPMTPGARDGALLQILLVLLLQNVHGIIDGDDAEHDTLLVDDGNGEQVVLGNGLCALLLVEVRNAR